MHRLTFTIQDSVLYVCVKWVFLVHVYTSLGTELFKRGWSLLIHHLFAKCFWKKSERSVQTIFQVYVYSNNSMELRTDFVPFSFVKIVFVFVYPFFVQFIAVSFIKITLQFLSHAKRTKRSGLNINRKQQKMLSSAPGREYLFWPQPLGCIDKYTIAYLDWSKANESIFYLVIMCVV